MVPLTVRFGDETLADGIDILPGPFYERLQQVHDLPTTSQPSPAVFTEVFTACLANPDDAVLSVHLSGKLSGTLQSAVLAAQEFPPDRVTVVDSRTVTIGMQLLLRAAAKERDNGIDVVDIVQNLKRRSEHLSIYVLFDTLTYLQKGGRIGRAQGFVGSVLNIKPIIEVCVGELLPKTRARSRRQGITELMNLVRQGGVVEDLGVMHSADATAATDLQSRLKRTYPDIDILVGEAGPVVGTYAGPGALGVACLRQWE